MTKQSEVSADADGLTAEDVILLLGLAPHPEGGFFRETFRDEIADGAGRAASTAIYFLLPKGVVSRWHVVDAAEAWHHYAGAPLRLSIAEPKLPRRDIIVGHNLQAGQRPQAVVPAGWWQQAESLGAWTLVGCTVAPGFQFEGFRLARDGTEPPFEA
ncbi:MAG: cupin domain-containing protein [Hyphomicrobium sp.]|nr:cupin domain-containing protein [Hyphomicrobium sp.]